MPRQPSIQEIEHGGDIHLATLEARNRILRQPLGLRLTEEDTRGEQSQRHFVILDHGRPLAGVVARATEPGEVRLRQMWVEPDLAGMGLGRALLEGVLARLASEGIGQVVLHARKPVLGFYQKCGFREEGPEFTEVGIPHRRMRRQLNPERQSPGCHR
ncbi:GNAT family N-acetyltransferase [Haloferula sp. A504]|uniref:GNAT family N-acetyltransferase n=1 Tax=Haloferula sp. A504 TaxID=3373601 RepID=UPI0031CAEA4A|nr:GNAT family N-acetyltransferase [Verrucomicrobiaceae bacterium E54]